MVTWLVVFCFCGLSPFASFASLDSRVFVHKVPRILWFIICPMCPIKLHWVIDIYVYRYRYRYRYICIRDTHHPLWKSSNDGCLLYPSISRFYAHCPQLRTSKNCPQLRGSLQLASGLYIIPIKRRVGRVGPVLTRVMVILPTGLNQE